MADLKRVLTEFQGPDALCKDYSTECAKWKTEGMCESKLEFMKRECRIACKYCDPATGHVLTLRGQYY